MCLCGKATVSEHHARDKRKLRPVSLKVFVHRNSHSTFSGLQACVQRLDNEAKTE